VKVCHPQLTARVRMQKSSASRPMANMSIETGEKEETMKVDLNPSDGVDGSSKDKSE
jgi:hypothetical protein